MTALAGVPVADRMGIKLHHWLRHLVRIMRACPCLGACSSASADAIYWGEYTSGFGAIKKLDVASGMISTFITGTGYGVGGNHIDYPQALTLDKSGNLYVGNANNGDIVKVTPQGMASDYFAIPDPQHYPHTYGLSFDMSGNLYVAMAAQGTVARLPPASTTESVFASGLDRPQGGAFDPAGNLYVYTSESVAGGANAVKITPGGVVSAFATGITALWWDAEGQLYTGTSLGEITVTTPSGMMSTLAVGLTFPIPLGLDAQSNLYVVESGGKSVLDIISPSGVVTTLAPIPDAIGYLAVSTPEPNALVGFLLSASMALCFARPRRARRA